MEVKVYWHDPPTPCGEASDAVFLQNSEIHCLLLNVSTVVGVLSLGLCRQLRGNPSHAKGGEGCWVTVYISTFRQPILYLLLPTPATFTRLGRNCTVSPFDSSTRNPTNISFPTIRISAPSIGCIASSFLEQTSLYSTWNMQFRGLLVYSTAPPPSPRRS